MTPLVSPRPARYAGLDGLRALAVALVLAYHLFPGWIFAGGFVGVDVFFVISGFLITTLLLAEHTERGKVSLLGFWRRRARRLLPALALLVTVCASLAWCVGGDVLAGIGWQVLGTATFSYNWLSLASGSEYFTSGSPELFRNLWSLAVEEQFYVLWPLLLPLVLLLPWRGTRVAVAAIAGAGSAVWMAQLASGGELTRGYYGTDSHAFGILLGVALAFALRRPEMLPRTRRWQVVALVAGVAAVAAIVGVGMLPTTASALTFPGALLAGCGATAVAIVAGIWPGSWFGRAIDAPPLRWIGDRSYGLYLWHWPLLVLVTTGVQGAGPSTGVPVELGLLVLALTVVAAELSYRLVEMPVRRHGFRGSIREIARAFRGAPLRRFGALAGAAAALLVLGGTTAAIASAPDETSAESAVQAGIDALGDQDPGSASPAPEPVPSPTPVTGGEITALGDSVMLASAPALVERFPGIQVDAAVSRQMAAAPDMLAQLDAAGQLRHYVVVGLGTNGPIDRETLDRIDEVVGPDRELILVRPYAPRDWIPGVNDELTAFVAAHRDVELADWRGAIEPRTDLLAGDKVHPGDAGGRLFADQVASAVDEAETKRANALYRDELRARDINNGIRPIEPR